MKKSYFYRFSAIAVLTVMLSGCTSSRVQNLIASGDDVSAIELLAPELIRNHDNKQLVPLFDEIYPKAVETRLPTKTINQIKNENLSPYGSTTSAALKACINEIGSERPLTDHSAISAVIYQGGREIRRLDDLSRIQNAVAYMPAAVGGPKTGYTMLVEKYVEKFPVELAQAKKDMGQFYYELAEAGFPGTTVSRKKELVNYYKKAAEYDFAYANNKSRLQQLSYEIAMILRKDASTKTQLTEALNYFNLAENYKDTATQIIAVKYELAELYRADETYLAYEKAGQLYSECGTYKNAANEARLFDFYKSIKGLTKNYSYGNIALTSGRFTEKKLTENISDIDVYQSRLSASLKTSEVEVYTNASENIVYPGAVIAGTSIPQQKFSLITSGARKPLGFNIIAGNHLLSRGVIRNSALASDSVNMVHAAAKSQYRYMTPECQYDFKTVYSPEELRMVVGVGADGAKLAVLDNKYWRTNRSYTVVSVTQKFYTAELEEPKLAIDMFDGSQKIPSAVEIGNVSPYYISSVDYGRKAYFVICSELPSEQIIEDVKKYRPGDYSKPNSTVTRRWDLNSTIITGIENSEKVYQILSFEDMFYWIQYGNYGNFGVEELPPISCRMKALVDGSYAVLSASTVQLIPNPDPRAALEKAEQERLEKERLERERLERERLERAQAANRPSSGSSSNAGDYGDLPVNITGINRGQTGSSGSTGTNTSTNTGAGTSTGSSGTATSPMYSNQYTSLVFVGKLGYYQCDRVTSGDEWIYYIAEGDITNCVASWDSSQYRTVYVNGINMTMNSTVYSFRDVIGNNISLDIIDVNGERKHHLLKILKK